MGNNWSSICRSSLDYWSSISRSIRVDSCSFIGDIGNISIIFIGVIFDMLSTSIGKSIGEGVRGNLIRVGWFFVGSSNLHSRCMVCWGSMDNWCMICWGSMYNRSSMCNHGSMYCMMGKWSMNGMGNWSMDSMGNNWSMDSMMSNRDNSSMSNSNWLVCTKSWLNLSKSL